MKHEDFNRIVEYRLEEISALLVEKGHEYATDDRLANFKQVGKLLGGSPEKALIGFVSKHIVSLFQSINELPDTGPTTQSVTFYIERIGDIMAYMLLLEGLLNERGFKTGLGCDTLKETTGL